MSLYDAAYTGDVELLRDLLKPGVKIDHHVDGYDTALHGAARAGHVDAVHMLIEAGANVCAKGWSERTPLHCAAMAGHMDAVRALIEAGADAQAVDQYSRSVLASVLLGMYVAPTGAMVRVLLDAIAASQRRLKDEQATTYVAEKCDHETMSEMLRLGILRAHDALHHAAARGYIEMMQVLLDAGACPLEVVGFGVRDHWHDRLQVSPIHLAAKNGHIQALCMLLSHETVRQKSRMKDALSSSHPTPLHLAAKSGHVQVVRALLADESLCRISGGATRYESPVQLAARNGHVSTLRLLLAAGADANTRTAFAGDPPLYLAASKGHAKAARVLLAAGADVNALSCSNDPPLHVAASPAVARVLIAAGAAVNARALERPLCRAIEWGRDGLACALLYAGAHVDATSELPRAIRNGCVEAVPLLLAAGADVNARCYAWACTPLLVAARNGDDVTARRLVAAGADVRARDDENLTALHCAASLWDDNVRLVALLLYYGADPLAAGGPSGKTPLQLARRRNLPTRRLLRRAERAARGRARWVLHRWRTYVSARRGDRRA